MTTCLVCGTDLPVQRGPRPRRYCSRACQAKAYRARQAQRDTRRVADETALLIAQYDGIPATALANQLARAAERLAGALTAGQPADETDLATLADLSAVLTIRVAVARERPSPAATEPAARPAQASRDASLDALPEEEARAIAAAAQLVRSDRAPRSWDLVAEDGAVIGHVGPARTGKGWEGWAAGTTQESAWRTHRTRQTAGYDAGAAWVHSHARR